MLLVDRDRSAAKSLRKLGEGSRIGLRLPSHRTGLAVLPHPALQSIVTDKQVGIHEHGLIAY